MFCACLRVDQRHGDPVVADDAGEVLPNEPDLLDDGVDRLRLDPLLLEGPGGDVGGPGEGKEPLGNGYPFAKIFEDL